VVIISVVIMPLAFFRGFSVIFSVVIISVVIISVVILRNISLCGNCLRDLPW